MGVRTTCTVVFGQRYIWWEPEMSYADVLICDSDKQQEAGPSFFLIWKAQSRCVDLLATYPLVDLRNSIS